MRAGVKDSTVAQRGFARDREIVGILDPQSQHERAEVQAAITRATTPALSR